MAVEFGTAKTVFILAIVVGCFAVLWPKLFYPMLQASVNPKAAGDSQACCDVIFENDVNAIKVITEVCGNILHQYDDFDPKMTQTFNQGKLTKEIVSTCREEVLNKCGIDITAFLNEKVRLGQSYKQILDEIRSFNSSICLKLNFGVNLNSLGAPRRVKLGVFTPKHYRQERPPHLRPDMMHPALRERGRAIPPSHIVPRTVEKEPRPPIPGMRPPMGGAGHVVPAPKSSSTMGIIMPIYTIGIVIFFMYTIMKVMFKKPSDSSANYADFTPDPEFRRMVFESPPYDDSLRQRSKLEPSPPWKTKEDSTKLVVTAISGLIAEVDQQREKLEKRQAEEQTDTESERKDEDKLAEKVEDSSVSKKPSQVEIKEVKDVGKSQEKPKVDSPVPSKQDTQVEKVDHPPEDKAKVKVMGMETTAMCEGGHRWSRPSTPILGIPGHSRSSTPVPPPTPEPQAIYLEGSLPSQSQLLVSDSILTVDRGDESEEDPDPPVILSGKMTLSLISLDAALAAEDEQFRKEQAEREGTADKSQEATGARAAVVASAISVSVDREDTEEEEEDQGAAEEEEHGDEGDPEAAGEEEEEEEDKHSERKEVHLVNDIQHDFDETPSATNFTTASAAAEATGNEETAADFSAMESFGPEDEQQDLDVEEEVWNGDVHSGEEEEEEEEPHPAPQAPHQ